MLHHVELYVSDLERSADFYALLLGPLGYEVERWSGGVNLIPQAGPYLCLLPAPPEHRSAGYHRKRVGLNHLAFHATSRAQVDALQERVEAAGHTVLYRDRYPYATAPGYYAMYCEDPDRIKVEVVAPPAD